MVGLVVTMSALVGYFLMIMGPVEGGEWNLNLHEARGLFVSNTLNIFGGLVTGPLYGFLGQHWQLGERGLAPHSWRVPSVWNRWR